MPPIYDSFYLYWHDTIETALLFHIGAAIYDVTVKRIKGTAFDEAMKARDRILDTVDMLIDEFIKENPEESKRAQTTIIGRLIYGKDKDNNRMMTRDEMKDNILNLIFAGQMRIFFLHGEVGYGTGTLGLRDT